MRTVRGYVYSVPHLPHLFLTVSLVKKSETFHFPVGSAYASIVFNLNEILLVAVTAYSIYHTFLSNLQFLQSNLLFLNHNVDQLQDTHGDHLV